jgi:hypothetical protein
MLLTGCGDLISVEAVGTRDNSVFDPALVGAWNAGDALVIVRAGEDKSYRIHWVSADGTETETPRFVRMEGRLAQVGGQRIFDLSAAPPGSAFSIPCHVFLRVRPVKDGLKVQFMDSKWLREQVKSSGLASFSWDGHPVLTGSPGTIESFLLKFGFDERALEDPIMLRPLKEK